MKLRTLTVVALLALLIFQVACTGTSDAEKAEDTTVVDNNDFFSDTMQGKDITLFTLSNGRLKATVTNYGGRLVSLYVPNRNDSLVDIIIGPESFKGMHESGERYFGATIGRFGNRIAKGTFALDGNTYQLPLNNGPNTLHGGPLGFHSVVWDAAQPNDSTVQLTYISPDGEMGFPGKMEASVTYTLTASNEMVIEYYAVTDKPTVCNLTNHAFFNLNGGGTINNHILQINADRYTPVDSTLIPTGELANVEGTPFDFRNPTPIGARVEDKHEQLTFGKGYDHNFCVNGDVNAMKSLCVIAGDVSGIIMEIMATEPGVQFYGGNFMQSKNAMKRNSKDDFRTAFCLEPQHYPDAPNRPDFPSTRLDPGQKYATKSIYRFTASSKPSN